MVRLAVALILSLVYAGVIVQVAGVRPANGFPLWFFVPGIVASIAALVAQVARRLLPSTWKGNSTGGDAPRRVQPSWHAVFRLSGYVPLLFFPWYILSILALHFDIRPAWYAVGALLALLVAHGLRRSLREVALLRDGAVTDALVTQTDRERSDLIHVWYEYVDQRGERLTGHGWRPEPVPEEGRTIPVYFDLNDSRRHVLAGASWFELA